MDKNKKIVAGASSYTYCKGNIEITIGTIMEYRRKGLALACVSLKPNLALCLLSEASTL